jgi:hypothetical protein
LTASPAAAMAVATAICLNRVMQLSSCDVIP